MRDSNFDGGNALRVRRVFLFGCVRRQLRDGEIRDMIEKGDLQA